MGVFIDYEQCGSYEVDRCACLECSGKDSASWHRHRPRNWHSLWTWACQKAEVYLVFMSNHYFRSVNCYKEMQYLLSVAPRAKVAFCILDAQVHCSVQSFATKVGVPREQVFNIQCIDFHNEECERLVSWLGKIVGEGSFSVVREDNQVQADRTTLDDNGK